PVILRGPDEMRAFYRDLDAPWVGGASLELEELIDAGEQVLVLIRFGGRGKMSGAEVEAFVWNVWTFHDGDPVRWTYFGEDRAGALEAAGLRE
ncbi:MAG TPA: nuclear transport factor 2 family protein, partial [Solirubrobacterales bacterium]|nr:nuclear transport factor 2 family protein [Solirubrobacterales bacterium]